MLVRHWPFEVAPRAATLNSRAFHLILSAAALGTTTLICYRLQAGFAVAAFLYFVVLVLQSLNGDLPAALATSVAAGALLEFFFIEPYLSFRVKRPIDALALATFLVTAFTISYLSSRLRFASLAAEWQRKNTERLYALAQEMLALDPDTVPRKKIFERFVQTFKMQAMCIAETGRIDVFPPGEPSAALESATRSAAAGLTSGVAADGIAVEIFDGAAGWSGAIGFEGLQNPEFTARPLAALAKLMLDRIQAHRAAKTASEAAESEVFRTAVLDALAHEFKTPLSTILAALGGIQETGPLASKQAELARVIESEAARLGSLTTRLVRTARLDRGQVKARRTEVDLEQLVLSVTRRYSRAWPNRRYAVTTAGGQSIQADPDLMRLAISQLLDNASKYSPPQSPIEIELEFRGSQATVGIWNAGARLEAPELQRIFERYYRGANSQSVPGTGLGLYVARKIAIAHGGDVEVQAATGARSAIMFRLCLPFVSNGDVPDA